MTPEGRDGIMCGTETLRHHYQCSQVPKRTQAYCLGHLEDKYCPHKYFGCTQSFYCSFLVLILNLGKAHLLQIPGRFNQLFFFYFLPVPNSHIYVTQPFLYELKLETLGEMGYSSVLLGQI